MRPPHLTPITDAETTHALRALKRYPSGLSRADLERLFGSDRRGREVMATLAERGVAPVINTKSDYGDGQVYRLARTAQEIDEAVATLSSYRASLDRRIKGLIDAWQDGGAPQPNLFQEAG